MLTLEHFEFSGCSEDTCIPINSNPSGLVCFNNNGPPESPEHVKKEKVILAVGTFSKRKNHQQLVKAFVESKVKDEYQLVIIGDKNRVFAESGLDENLLINANISIYDRLSSEELISMYVRAEVLVSLSVYEGFGIPVLEGLYSGCNVICSDINVYRELYDGYVHFCDPYDINSISAALENVTNQKNTGKNPEALFEKYNYTRSGLVIIDQIMGNVQAE